MRPLIVIFCILFLSPGCASTGDSLQASPHGADLVKEARKQIGVNYQFGGSSPEEGFDCSGLVWYCSKQIGMALPRTTAVLFRMGHAVPKGHLHPGDLVFFDMLGYGASHVGIYAGQDTMIHAPSTGKKVCEEKIGTKFWLRRFVGARRLD
jgi:cell wall-associated NlpC family hydrolase